MEKQVTLFNSYFGRWAFDFTNDDSSNVRGRWAIELPSEAVANRQAGVLRWMDGDSWMIWFKFGEDENGEYLEFYAAHHMTNARHSRIYADGRVMPLIDGYVEGFPRDVSSLGFSDTPVYDLPPLPVRQAIYRRASGSRRNREV